MLQSMGSQKVRHDLATEQHIYTHTHTITIYMYMYIYIFLTRGNGLTAIHVITCKEKDVGRRNFTLLFIVF